MLVLVLATLFLAVSFGREALAIRQKAEALQALQAQVADLREKRDELRRWLDVARSPEHLRRIGHDQMMMGFPGEEHWVPYVPARAVPEGTNLAPNEAPPQPQAASPPPSGEYWALWHQYLFK
ncbi:MAG: hypothetical protein ACUVWW_11420 [Anaerolineae bacterium]